MNLHIESDDLNIIFKHELKSFMFGSRVYGTDTDDSDTDYMIIVPTAIQRATSVTRTIHNLQGKLDGVDYVINDTMMYFNNLVNGDSTINFEILVNMTDEFGGISEYKTEFITYNLIKCYLGMAKRDLKYNSEKKFKHAMRGLQVARHLLDGKADISFDPNKKMGISDAYEWCRDMRDDLNKRMETGKIHRMPSLNVIRKVNEIIANTTVSNEELAAVFSNHEYNALLNGVSYA